MSSLEDKPTAEFRRGGRSEVDTLQRRQLLMLGLRKLTRKFVDLSLTYKEQSKKVEGKKAELYPRIDSMCAYMYACEVMSLGREGDGWYVYPLQRALLPITASDRTNYSIEAPTLLAQYEYLLIPRIAQYEYLLIPRIAQYEYLLIPRIAMQLK